MEKENREISLLFLGLKIESRMIDEGNSTSVTEIVEVTAGSVADHYGQLQIGK